MPLNKETERKIRQTRHVGQDEIISDVLQWTSSHGLISTDWTSRTYVQQLCTDIGCRLEYLPEVMYDRGKW